MRIDASRSLAPVAFSEIESQEQHADHALGFFCAAQELVDGLIEEGTPRAVIAAALRNPSGGGGFATMVRALMCQESRRRGCSLEEAAEMCAMQARILEGEIRSEAEHPLTFGGTVWA